MKINDDVLILSGKYNGYTGYVLHLVAPNKVAVRYQSGLGYQTAIYLIKNVRLKHRVST